MFSKPGSGAITVNGRPVERYFPRQTSQMIVRQALELVEKSSEFDVDGERVWRRRVGPGGRSAPRHLARAAGRSTPTLRRKLKENGFLTRDSRKKERKKPGQPGARKRFQYSKR